ncbi:DHA2 family efflux MFS transporter permease subunit [Streptomyces sp. NBC_01481]|uniref:DHA2 family efflux MFS transporter permease subunit n=1 Tax=Streptomyces sp. NBC_01481 TaxID=2975869 RepID=UPI00224F48B1|nr:DHA2 family efflux MFS transporter permease subunit [Streptomyces sp. NBC_01481]MCX4586026.1 DHA2 family efflux MFS transporter permease subunit [Streptomyces sp. NBC_01481]
MHRPRDGRRTLVLAVCCLSVLLVSLDTTILNVALPSMQQDLHSSVSGLQWTLDAYAIVLAALLTLAGSTADRVGRRRIFQLGLVLFTAASALCSLAPTTGWLVVFRMVQAVGGSMLTPVAMAILTNTFPEPRERARAIGVWGGVVGISMAAGPVIGGVLVQSVGWRSVFWLNVPIGLAALILTALFVPESRAARARRADPVGQLLVIVLLGALTYAAIEAPGKGWTSPLIVACLIAAAGALGGLVPYENRRAEPLIDPRLFRSAPFSGATLTALFAFAALGGFLFANALYLQGELGLSPLEAGLRMLPMAVLSLVCPPLSGRIVGSRGPRVPLLIAGAGIAASGVLAVLVTRSAHPSYVLLALVYALFGLGFGFVNAPITDTAVAGLPRDRAGVAAAVAATSRQVGSAIGIAVIGGVVGAGARAAAWWIIAGCGLAVLALSAVTAGRRSPGGAGRVSADVDSEQSMPVPLTGR